jgi:hypothetical protein
MRRVLIAASLMAVSTIGVAAQTRPSTYIGCLRGNDGSFVLTEVGGPNVPETRSWQSLYMSKVRVLEVQPMNHNLDMQSHVGHTVKMTGTVEGKTLRARSMTFIGATCK